MNIFQKERKNLEKFLKEKKLRLTSERTVLLEEVLRMHGHFSAEEIMKEVKLKNITISRASVYRNLSILVQAGIIRETAYGEKHKHFEHIYDEKLHHHARCIICQSVIELPCYQCDRKPENDLRLRDFQVISHELTFYGICGRCRQKKHQQEQQKS